MTDLDWTRVERRLRSADNYWLATTRPDGRPHCAPVWGLWIETALWFWTPPASVKGRNLAADPRAVAHLESGDDVVIVEGRAEPVDPGKAPLAAYRAKYQDLDPANLAADEPYVLRPRLVRAWYEPHLTTTMTRWTFE